MTLYFHCGEFLCTVGLTLSHADSVNGLYDYTWWLLFDKGVAVGEIVYMITLKDLYVKNYEG